MKQVLLVFAFALDCQSFMFAHVSSCFHRARPLMCDNSQQRWGAVIRQASSVTHMMASSSPPSDSGEKATTAATVTSLPPVPPKAHRIVLMRHGESEFNNANVFTGWCDVALTQRGVVEAVEAGQVFSSHQMFFRRCYASLLTRSIVTAHRSLEAAGLAHTPIQYDVRFNERHYGALQGLGKERTAERLGRDVVMEWRRSYDARPPLMTPDHPHYSIIYNDPRYRRIQDMTLPLGESLADCQIRAVAAWNDILDSLVATESIGSSEAEDGGATLIVAHANTLRALVMHLDAIPTTAIESLNIPTAIPFFYDVSLPSGSVVSDKPSGSFRGVYISDDRKKRNYLERRRAANDPFLWALYDHQVASSMLVGNNSTEAAPSKKVDAVAEGLAGIEEEAKRNTQLYSSIVVASSENKSN